MNSDMNKHAYKEFSTAEEVDKEVVDLLACHMVVGDTSDMGHIQEQRAASEAGLLVAELDVVT